MPSPRSLLASAVYEWSKLPAIPTRVGERRDFFDRPTRTMRNLECHATTLHPGERAHEAHRHPDEELVIVKEGTLEVTINDRVELAGPGSLLFFAANDLHGMRAIGDGQVSYHVIRILTAETPSI
ncbi:cupin domain-containing protein [Opitutus sp. ER46]|uniref:cupin domain-containing protein n=1 Tax=Opitutus sp. ER46 TaxID=2161864 RepID=UPI000D314228|nr:cupin domain-containing protein [Opitutus sp. ER46]PTX98921.1 cupin domain-containing protein [Opitutus sp. ER46]